MNIVILRGNLTRDPVLRYVPSGNALATFGMGHNRKYKTTGGDWKTEVTFVDITVWGNQAEACAKYLTKGAPCIVQGRLKYSIWESDQGGKRSKIDVTADRVVFLGRKDNKDDDAGEDDVPF